MQIQLDEDPIGDSMIDYLIDLDNEEPFLDYKETLNISGEKVGMPVNCICSPSVSVSPILKLPVSNKPTTSPGNASSITSFSRARKEYGLLKRTSFPTRVCL